MTCWVAYSGGLDSQVLLHILSQEKRSLPFSIAIIHIHHGLHPQANQWAAFCKAESQKLKIPFHLVRVNAKARKEESPEEAARRARYEALRKFIKPSDYLLTAHHQDDQAETLLLQLFRGSGVKGLAAMPACARFGKGFHLRPLLNFTRAELENYARKNHLQWIEDDSNQNLKFDRNFIRHQVMPLLSKRWPSVSQTLSRTSRHCGEASVLLEELAKEDLKVEKPDQISLSLLKKFSKPRQKNLIRYWLHQLKFPVPNEIQLNHILNDFIASKQDRNPIVHWENVVLRRYRGNICVSSFSQGEEIMRRDKSRLYTSKEASYIWSWQKPLNIPGVGNLLAKRVKGQGVRLDFIQNKTLSVRFRKGGERFHPEGRQGSHPLKKLFQEWKIPTWLRDNWPLIYLEGQCIAVPQGSVKQGLMATGKQIGLTFYLSPSY